MTTAIVREVTIPSTAAAAWAALTDFATMHEWFVGVRRVSLGTEPGMGATRTVVLQSGLSYHEEIVVWDPVHRFAYVVTEPPWLFAAYRVDIEIPTAPSGARLQWTIRYAVRFGWIGRALEMMMVRPLLGVVLSLSLRRLRARVMRVAPAADRARGLT